MKIRNKQRYGQFIYLICFVQTIIQENVFCFAGIQKHQSQIIFQGVYGLPHNAKSYYTPPSPPLEQQQQQQTLQKRGGKGMDRHLFASAAAATLAMGTAAMGVSTYSIRLNDWHKYKGGGTKKEEKDKKPKSIDTKAANKEKNKDNKPSSPGSPKYYNSRVTVNNYYGAQKPPPPPKEEAGKKQKRSLEIDEDMQYPIRKRNKFKSAGKGLNRVISGAYSSSCTTFTTFCITTTKLMHYSSSSSSIVSEVSSASSASSRVGRTTKAAGKTFGEMIGMAKPVREGKAGHIPAVSSSKSETIGKTHHPRANQSKSSSSPSRRPTQGTLPSHTSPPSTENHSVTKAEKPNRKNVDQINPVTGKAYAPETHFLNYDMSKHDKWAKFAGRVEDYGKVSAATGAFAAAGIALHTTVLQHNHDAKKAKKEGKEEEKKKD